MSTQIKVVVCGAMGRMGQRVIQAAMSRDNMAITGAVEYAQSPAIGQNIGALIGQLDLDLKVVSDLSQVASGADVYIDFSTIESSLAHVSAAAKLGIAAVIGTTGLSVEQQEILKRAAEKIPVLWAPNMSTGVNVMYKIAAAMVKLLGPDFDLEIVEAHHNLKKDAPSGTAVRLYETLAHARENVSSQMVCGREGQVGARTKNEIGVLALRGGDIVGDHTVYFCGPGERLELTHRASTRETFAQGAVRAAAWLAHKAPGLYSIEDTMALSI